MVIQIFYVYPLQTMKKAQRDSATTRRHITENLKEVLNRDVSQAFAQFRASLLQVKNDNAKISIYLLLTYMLINSTLTEITLHLSFTVL